MPVIVIIAELDIRNQIVELIQATQGAGKVYNRYRKPTDGLLSQFTDLNIDDASQINVVFVRRVSFVEHTTDFDEHLSSDEVYELWFYRGIVDAEDAVDLEGTSSESVLELFIENCRRTFQGNKNLLMPPEDTPGKLVSQAGLGTAGPLIDTDELGGYACHRFVARLSVTIEQC